MLMCSVNSHTGRVFSCSKQLFLISILGLVFLLVPVQSFASSAIAAQVAAACAPEPTVPDVGSCSACHSTTNNRGPNDLTTAGTWALSTATYMNFCPTATTPPPTTPPPTPTPPPTSPPPGSPATPSPSPTPSMGGSGASDDDDDEGEADDDDDGAAGSASSRSSSFSSRLSALRARVRSILLGP